MMRLKPFSRSLVRAALLLLSFSLYINLSGCQSSLEPTYKEKDIPRLVKQICQDEYNLDVTVAGTETTLWVYMPLSKILHKDYGAKEGKVFDDELMDKLRNILSTVGRVVLSADKAPEFFALWSSDINIGLDYIIIGNVLDIKKSYAGSIPPTELNQRYLIKFGVNPEAIGDSAGRHAGFYNITLPDFLAQQIAQRVSVKFQGNPLKEYFKFEGIGGLFNNNTFILEYRIIPVARPKEEIDVAKEVLDIAAYCIKTYEFQDFSGVQMNDLNKQDRIILNKGDILARPALLN